MIEVEEKANDSRKNNVIRLDEELAEKLNHEPNDHLETVQEQEGEGEDEEQEVVAPQMIEEKVAEKPEIATAKIPKQKKKK